MMRALLLLLLVGCSDAPKDVAPAETAAPKHTGAAHTGAAHTGTPHTAETGHAVIVGPAQGHVSPPDDTMCFACHLCGNDGAKTLEVTHWVCVDCHRGPDGSVPEEVQSDCGCGALDCSTEPPTLPCGDCHVVDGTNDYPSTQHMNDLCVACHAAGEGALRPNTPNPHGG